MIKRLLLLFLTVVFLGEARAQLFPAQATTQLTPPYSLFLADYVAPGSERLALHVFLRDVSRPDINVRFRLRIIGQGITIETKPEFIPSPVSLQGGVPLRLIGTDLAEYFEPRNLNFSGISQREYERRGGLPEGLYQFCFEVLEYNRGVKISNTGCASAWLILNDPPIVNLPRDNDRIRPQDPQQVIFQWTPRHTGSPNAAFTTEYEFKLVELWPATRNPNDAILTSPPIFETTTRSTTLVYGPAETPLELGRRYAYQIKAKSIVGVEELNLFKNGGKSQVYTFQYGDACNVPQRILGDATGATRFTVAWDAANSHTAWKLRYRQHTPDAEWYTATSSLPELEITSLQATTTYEYEVMAVCGSFESPYSPITTITTRETPTIAYSCGLPVEDFNLDPSQLIPELKKGDVIDAGDFDVKLLTVSGGNGIFSGEGAIEVPYFNQVKAKVVFENIKVNNDKRLVAGVMNVTGGGVEIVPEGVMDFMDQLSEVLDIADSALNIIDALIPDNPPDPATFIADTVITVTGPLTVYPDLSNNGSVIVVDGNGNQQTLPPGTNYAITDDKGNGYLVDNKGQVTRTTAAQATASANREFNLKMKFEKARDGLYGLDNKTIESLARNYEILNNNYSVSWKAVAANSNERVVAKLEDADIDASRVKYELSGTELVATATGEQAAYLLNIIGKSAGTVDELVGKLPAANENDKEQVLGKLNVVSYDKKNYKLVLVPVNHRDNNKTEYPHNIDQLKADLNKIYSQAVVEWTVRDEDNLLVSGLSDTFDDGQSNAFSNYTEDMKKVINAFLAKHSFEEDTYYIFLLNKPKTVSKLGFMPRKKQAGFVFLDTHGGNENLLVKTIAHELAHGVFRLQHLWEEYSELKINTTDNLMDYTSGTKLLKFQWDLIHNPVAVLGLFEDDEDGAYVSESGEQQVARIINSIRCGLKKQNQEIEIHYGQYAYEVKLGRVISMLDFQDYGSLSTQEFKDAKLLVSIGGYGNEGFFGGYKDLKINLNQFDYKPEDRLVIPGASGSLIFKFSFISDATTKRNVYQWLSSTLSKESASASTFVVNNSKAWKADEIMLFSQCELEQLSRENRKKLMSELVENQQSNVPWTNVGIDKDTYQYLLINLLKSTPQVDRSYFYGQLKANPRWMLYPYEVMDLDQREKYVKLITEWWLASTASAPESSEHVVINYSVFGNPNNLVETTSSYSKIDFKTRGINNKVTYVPETTLCSLAPLDVIEISFRSQNATKKSTVLPAILVKYMIDKGTYQDIKDLGWTMFNAATLLTGVGEIGLAIQGIKNTKFALTAFRLLLGTSDIVTSIGSTYCTQARSSTEFCKEFSRFEVLIGVGLFTASSLDLMYAKLSKSYKDLPSNSFDTHPEHKVFLENDLDLGKVHVTGAGRHPNWVEITGITSKIEARMPHVDYLDFRGNGFEGCHTQNAMNQYLANNPGWTGGFVDANGNAISLLDNVPIEAYPWVKDIDGKIFTKTNGAQKSINGVQYGKASFFPKNWSAAKLKAEVEYAISNNHGLVTGNTYKGFSTDGTVEIRFYYSTSDGSIISFFPKVN